MANETTANDEGQTREPLEEACARNVPLELHSISSDRTDPAARARMIDLDDEHIYLERPQIIGRNVRIHTAQQFEAFFSFADVLFTFKCRVVETDASVRLNERKLVDGLIVTRPAQVKPGQRRQFFRTSLATLADPVAAQLQEIHADAESPVPDELGHWMEGTVVDASAGGFGIRVEDANYSRFKIYHNYFIRFTVPGDGPELTTMCELRQARPILGGEATKLGFLLLPWPSQAKLNWKLQPLLTYLTQLQRSRLAG